MRVNYLHTYGNWASFMSFYLSKKKMALLSSNVHKVSVGKIIFVQLYY